MKNFKCEFQAYKTRIANQPRKGKWDCKSKNQATHDDYKKTKGWNPEGFARGHLLPNALFDQVLEIIFVYMFQI